jgi:acetyl esterase
MRRGTFAAVLALTAVLLVGCTVPAPSPAPSSSDATGVRIERSIVYRTVEGRSLAAEACLPAPARRAPALVLVHSGGFSQGSRTDLEFVCTAAARAGIATFSVDYRLLPARYPAQAQDVAAAVAWLGEPAQQRRFSLRPGRIALLGTSAGAVVAAQLATRTPGSPLDPRTLSAVVLMSGLYDANGDLGGLRSVADAYLGCADGSAGCVATRRKASAVGAASDGDPPMLLVGSRDEIVPLSQLQGFASALQRAGVPHQQLVVDGDAHAEAVLVSDPSAARTVLAFLQRAFTAR